MLEIRLVNSNTAVLELITIVHVLDEQDSLAPGMELMLVAELRGNLVSMNDNGCLRLYSYGV